MFDQTISGKKSIVDIDQPNKQSLSGKARRSGKYQTTNHGKVLFCRPQSLPNSNIKIKSACQILHDQYVGFVFCVPLRFFGLVWGGGE